MEQKQLLIDHVLKRISLNEEEILDFISFFKTAKVKKHQFIIQPDFVAKYRNYVVYVFKLNWTFSKRVFS